MSFPHTAGRAAGGRCGKQKVARAPTRLSLSKRRCPAPSHGETVRGRVAPGGTVAALSTIIGAAGRQLYSRSAFCRTGPARRHSGLVT